ncbi:putative nuclease HARBI1 [Ochlerotatus camptorhynchus]|uniref:putative nuclease HARBI1 n=1 Tax=Ochlerotatus camptorhynchus TaxID=644619 RepID=UPI0031DACB0A
MEFIEMLLSSSSSSSDDDSDTEILFSNLDSSDGPQRKKIRIYNFVEDFVDNYSDEQFRQQFRLKRCTAEFIIDKYKSSTFGHVNEGKGRKGITPKNQILAFLWFSANKNSYREVCTLFDMAESTFCNHLNSILDFFYDISKHIIKFPETEDGKERVAANFKKISKFDNVLGCIDGSYVSIRKPAKKIKSTYVNRHDMLSITLQGVCDANKSFMDICVGSPSKIHDSRIFTLSPLSDDLPQICHQKFHLLGDAAYPLREYLLTPYRNDGRMNQKKRKYNLKHAQTRVLIENAFGLLKTRFRQLMRLDFFFVERMCKFVTACCVLHNICISFNDNIEVDAETTQHENNHARDVIDVAPNNPDIRNAALRRLGEIKRNNIADSFQ